MKEKLEKLLNKKISEFQKLDFIDLVKNEPAMQFIAENPVQISELFLKESSDEFVKEQFLPVLVNAKLAEKEQEIGAEFSKHEEDIPALESYCKEYIKNHDDFYSLLPIYFVIMSTGLNVSLEAERDRAKKCLEDFIEILNTINIEVGYEAVCDCLDFANNFRQEYFEKFQEDPLKNSVAYITLTKGLTDFAEPYYEKIQNEFKEKMNGITPEDLGIPDLTTIKEEGEE